MKTKKLNLFVSAILSCMFLSFISCSNLTNSGANGNIAITFNTKSFADLINVYADEASGEYEKEMEIDLVLRVSLKGDYEVNLEEIPVNLDTFTSIKASFENIPVKSNVRVCVSLYSYFDDFVLYEGESESIVVKAGVNLPVSIQLHRPEEEPAAGISTPIVLWNCEGQEEKVVKGSGAENTETIGPDLKKGIQLFDAVYEDIELTGEVLLQNSIIKNFCYDSQTGDLYIFALVPNDDVITTYVPCIYKVEYGTNSLVMMAYDFSTGITQYEGWIKSMVYYNNAIYYLSLGDSSSDSGELCVVPLSSEEPFDVVFLEDGDSVDMTSISAVAEGNGYLYLSWTEDNEIYIGKYYYSDGFWLVTKEVVLNENILLSKGISKLEGSDFYINDMQIKNNEIYALLMESDHYYVTKGGLVKFIETSTSIEAVPFYGSNYVIGWYSPLAPGYETYENNPLYDERDCLTNIFYGPRRFVALRPEELYIVDEGFLCDGNSDIRTSNRVVKINLKDSCAMESFNVKATLSIKTSGSMFSYY